MASASDILGDTKTRVIEAAGGPARLQIIAILGGILGLATADLGTVSAVSDQLKRAFHIGNTEIGLLLAVVSFVGALGTLPAGVFADRIERRLILIIVVLGWGAAQIVTGFSSSFAMLLLTRLGVGVMIAAAWPCIASLTGDFFPARERAKIYGLILSGELIGAGIGFFISGEVSSFVGWRWSLFVMAAPSLPAAWVICRYLPEPRRGAQSWLRPGARDPEEATKPPRGKTGKAGAPEKPSAVQEAVLDADIEPRPELILHEDPSAFGLWRAMTYLLRLPSYRMLIIASGLAYYFFSGIRAFAMIYFTGHYHLSRGTVAALIMALGVGAIVGLLMGGRISERLLERGKFNARILVPAVALFASVPFFALGIWIGSAWLGIVLMTVGTGLLAAAVAPIDAARLDIVHPRMWGRGEAGRMALRSLLEGGAPLLFGQVSEWLGGGTNGLMWTFLIMLVPMLAAGCFVLPGRRAYPRDVATAAASVEATGKRKEKAESKATE